MRIELFIAAGLALQMPLTAARAQDAAETSAAGPVDPAFAGHYYLSGVMETGSELLLRPDGTFEWYISYGALDQFSRGAWHRQGGEIVLVASRPGKDRPLFAYLDRQPWSADAEQERLDREQAALEESVRRRCPFLVGGIVTAEPVVEPAPMLDIGTGEEAATQEDDARQVKARAAADAAIAAARTARERLESTARRVMAKGAAMKEEEEGEARRLTQAWEEARGAALQAAREAGMAEPDLSEPELPEACRLPDSVAAEAQPSERWRGGLAVLVVDPQAGEEARGVHVELRFADGQESEVTTSGGLALVRDGDGAPLVAAVLSAPYAPGRSIEVAVPEVRSGVVRFSIDAEQVTASPFERMTLRIDGTSLLPSELGRGRYSR